MKLLHRFLQLPIITPFPPGMTAAGAANFSLEALMSNANAYAEATVTLATAGTDITLTTAQLLAKNIVLTVGASGAFTITLPATSKILDALGPTMPRDGSFYFPVYISNRATTFTGTLTAADGATTFSGPTTLDTDANGKWIVRVNAPISASAQPTLTFTRISTCDAGGGSSGGGTGTVTSIAATTPIVVTPSPITATGTVSHAASGVTAATYGDSFNVPQVTINATGHVTAATSVPISGSAGGTVTSVAQTVPAEFIITGSPIIGSGTLAITKATETANTVWAGPTTGAAAQPTFRALVAADIPVNNFGTIVVAGQSDVVADAPTDTLTLVAGTNVTLTTNAGTDTVTIAASGGATNSFETIAVSGQSDVVADSPTDTLTLVAGSNVTITTNAGTDTITIAATAGSGGGFSNSEVLTGSGNWNVPADVSAVEITMIGGGAGGATSTSAAVAGGGGGSGELCENETVSVTPSGTVAYAVGAGGATDTDGGDTTFGVFICKGGLKGVTSTGGAGGGPRGGAGGGAGTLGVFGNPESSCFFGGSGAGGGGASISQSGAAGGGGAGEECTKVAIPVTPGGTLAITMNGTIGSLPGGQGGANATIGTNVNCTATEGSTNSVGGNGGADLVVGPMRLKGGFGGLSSNVFSHAGMGGGTCAGRQGNNGGLAGANGAGQIGLNGLPGYSAVRKNGARWYSGPGGGSGGGSGSSAGGAGAGGPGHAGGVGGAIGAGDGGGGGAGSKYANGGSGGDYGVAGGNGSMGSGGGGAGGKPGPNLTGGNGGGAYCIIFWHEK